MDCVKIIFTDHIKTRLKQRRISAKIVEEIFKQNLENYWDNLRNHYIVIGEVNYQGETRKLLVAYDKIGDIAEAVTIHPITDEQVKQRINSGRWSYEKNKRKES